MFDWKELLTRWSAEIIDSGEYQDQLPPEVIASGWLGYPGATDARLAAAQARLGTTLPPSYREFLKLTNGWRMTTSFIEQVYSTEEIAWYADQDPETIAIWAEGGDDPATDAEYLVYGERVDQPLRASYFKTALAISAYGDGIYLLNPRTVTPEGEWEAWFFAPWVPGARRYRSFWEMMLAQHESFLFGLRSKRGEPTPNVDPALGVDAEDLAGLIAALRRPEQRDRMAALDAIGNLRDSRALEPVLDIFRNPDEDLFVRESAARALGELGDVRAAQPLIDAFRERPDANQPPNLATLGPGMEDVSLDDLIAQMEAMLGPAMGEQVRQTLSPAAVNKGLGEHLNNAVIQGLLALGKTAVPTLLAALEDTDPGIRREVARTLEAMRSYVKDDRIEQALRSLHERDG